MYVVMGHTTGWTRRTAILRTRRFRCGRRLIHRVVETLRGGPWYPLERGNEELHAPGVHRALESIKLEQLTAEERERYVLGNIEQSEKLTEEL